MQSSMYYNRSITEALPKHKQMIELIRPHNEAFFSLFIVDFYDIPNLLYNTFRIGFSSHFLYKNYLFV